LVAGIQAPWAAVLLAGENAYFARDATQELQIGWWAAPAGVGCAEVAVCLELASAVFVFVSRVGSSQMLVAAA